MPLNLPAHGQPNWDPDLNAYINDIKATANAAETPAGAQAKADAAQVNAVSQAATTAQTKADTAQANATTAAAADATSKANAVQANLNTHTANVANPHSVTKAQVGLGNVDNTSDANKPVSTAQQTALDAKQDTSRTRRQSQVLTNGSDQTTLLNSETASAASEGRTLELPAGIITINGAWSIPDRTRIVGSGYGTTINFTGAGTLLTLSAKTGVVIHNVRMHATQAGAKVLDLSGSFRCVFGNVTIDGEHTAATGSTYRTQVGLTLRDNSGDNRFNDCDINNLGVGISTDTIQNYFNGCNVGTCWKSIQGGDAAGVNYRAGISFKNGTLVGTIGATDTHIDILGSSAEWWFDGVHVEKCDKAAVVGNASGGPRSFSLSNTFLASTTTSLNIVGCRQPWLSNITFSADSGTPTDLVIDATHTPDGFASNLRPSAATFDFADSVFPAGWAVLGNRSASGKLPRLTQAETWQALLPVSVPPVGNANFAANAAFDATYPMGIYRASTGVQNAEVSWEVSLSAGTWTFQLAHVLNANRGIYTVQIDGVTVGTIDGYTASGAPVTFSNITGISVASGGVHTVRLLMATKNASSSAYYGTPSFLAFTRTA